MGNNIGRNKTAKVMKIDGEIFKLKLPLKAIDVLKDYPLTYVLLESESVKRFGIRAPKLRPEEDLKPKKIYFLVDLPQFPEEMERGAKRVGSEVNMGRTHERRESGCEVGSGDGPVRVKIRVPRTRIEKLMEEGGNEAQVAESIVNLCLQEL